MKVAMMIMLWTRSDPSVNSCENTFQVSDPQYIILKIKHMSEEKTKLKTFKAWGF